MSQKQTRPSAKEWITFWEALARLRIQDWKEDYSTQQVRPGITIYDGHQWTFTCRRGEFAVRPSGQNAYSELPNPQKTTMDEAGFSRLTEAFENLVNAPAH
jgi:hypothetical protein